MQDLIEDCKAKVGGIIQKPKMSDKLLSKPPFRFLHDTVSAVIQTTGFAEGLYSAEEKDSSTITERDAKIAYLQKIFTCVGICLGQPLDVKPQKVVAGQEADLTCAFLIALADCATNPQVDVAASVQRTHAGEEPGQGPPAIKGGGSDAKGGGGGGDDMKGGPMEMPVPAEAKAMDAPPERGTSRGGNRGGGSKQTMPTAESAGLSAPSAQGNQNQGLIDAEVDRCDGSIGMTQELLQPLLTKPKLSDKLLNKPPFRFLHDVFMEVIRQTGFAQNLFAPEEMESAQVSDKEQKLVFLEKIITLVGVQLQTNLTDVKPLKIIQGLEANATNRFLQCLAIAAKNCPDSTNAVRMVLDQLGGTNTGSVAPASEPPSQPKQMSAPAVADEKPSERSPPPKTQPQYKEPEPPMQSAADEQPEPSGGGDDEEKRSMRPTTARRRPPKVKDGAKEVDVKDIAPSATAKKAEGILVDGGDDDDEEDILENDDDRRLAEQVQEFADAKNAGGDSAQSKIVQDIKNRQMEQEALARGITSIPTADGDAEPLSLAGAEEKPSRGIRIGGLKKTGMDKRGASPNPGSGGSGGSSADIEKMRNVIQLLVKCTGPLGSCMDFIQEDIGMMTNELKKWEEECRKYVSIYIYSMFCSLLTMHRVVLCCILCYRYEVQLDAEKTESAEKIKPLTNQLADLDAQIQDEVARISATKANIARNENNIQQILKTIVMA